MRSLYLLVLFFSVIVPLLFSFHPGIRFYRMWKAFFPGCLLVMLLFVAWDIAFTYLGVWNFNPRYVIGIYLVNLPIEEVLFFIVIPFCCVFTYHCLNSFYDLSWDPGTLKIFCLSLSFVLLLTGILFIDRLYTVGSFISTALILLALLFAGRVRWLGQAITVYTILLLPFFIVNGILTGTGPSEAVVQYNNSENLGIRLLTIPVEDIFYGFSLFLLNLFFYQPRTNFSLTTAPATK